MIDWHRITLLLTSSIKPNVGLKDNAILDPQRREADYAAALAFNLTNFPQFQRVVLVDNSGWPLDRLREVADRTRSVDTCVEFVSFEGNDFPPHFGKGYGEAELIAQALQRSELLSDTPMVAKMTGRHLLRNMTTLVTRIGGAFELACDLRDHGIYERLGMNRCGRHFDSRFFVADRKFYQTHFAELHRGHTEGEFSMEGVFYNRVKQLAPTADLLCRFPIEPIYGGIAGHGDKNYDGARERMKRGTRQAMRRLMPWLHI